MRPWESAPGFYAGIGSRRTPPHVLDLMRSVAAALGRLGWTLRSGGADGADSAFEEGADLGEWPKQIFLPWPGFNGRSSRYDRPSAHALSVARRYHPQWGRVSDAAKLLHARNTHQVLGPDACDRPSAFLLCWTPDGAVSVTGRDTGGTGQAIRIASTWDIPVHNLAVASCFEEWSELAARA